MEYESWIETKSPTHFLAKDEHSSLPQVLNALCKFIKENSPSACLIELDRYYFKTNDPSMISI
jgi:hypothetical protein